MLRSIEVVERLVSTGSHLRVERSVFLFRSLGVTGMCQTQSRAAVYQHLTQVETQTDLEIRLAYCCQMWTLLK